MIIWKLKNPYYVHGNPYNWRTWLRIHLPFAIAQFVEKGEDCEKYNSEHLWYTSDNKFRACYHCKVLKKAKKEGNNL